MRFCPVFVCLAFAGFCACGGGTSPPPLGGGEASGSTTNGGSGNVSGAGGTGSSMASGSGASTSGSSTGVAGGGSGTGAGSASGSSDGGLGNDGASGDGASGGSGRDGGHIGTYPPISAGAIGNAVLVSSQFYFTEGPVWDPSKNVLYFTDINAQQSGRTDGAIYRLTPPNTIDVFLEPSGSCDGIGLDPQGNIIAAGFPARNAWRLSSSKSMQVFSPCSGGAGTCFMGTEINTPDDITSRSDGVIYFTDPTFANGGQGFPAASLTLGFQGVYRITTDGMLHVEDKTTSGPNGVNLSPDEKTLYVAYTTANQVSKFSVAADGSLGNKTFFASANLADSMCVDAGGNVYVGTSGGLAVFTPAGQAVKTISAGGQIVTNCAFGGTDQKTLYITSHSSGTLVGAPTPGSSSLYRVDNMPVPGIPGQN
ncbi:MAG TPA: SMP-30/gluconolactonase/LRE family protein [Polyangiaceae bacterium]|nr:SMP-30/gluconolactonase/LRE family protein [Polyangiaceae bacterium]